MYYTICIVINVKNKIHLINKDKDIIVGVTSYISDTQNDFSFGRDQVRIP